MIKSSPHRLLVLHIKAHGLPEPKEEYRFDPERRWRFDLCWPDRMIAAEVHGGVYTSGRHTKGEGFSNDREKMNAATEAGWRVFEYTTKQVERGDAIAQLGRVLNGGNT